MPKAEAYKLLLFSFRRQFRDFGGVPLTVCSVYGYI
nr:MAG TPA: hypothetical protein [Caudoviricetes sp.]